MIQLSKYIDEGFFQNAGISPMEDWITDVFEKHLKRKRAVSFDEKDKYGDRYDTFLITRDILRDNHTLLFHELDKRGNVTSRWFLLDMNKIPQLLKFRELSHIFTIRHNKNEIEIIFTEDFKVVPFNKKIEHTNPVAVVIDYRNNKQEGIIVSGPTELKQSIYTE